jgi:hypothetical protein
MKKSDLYRALRSELHRHDFSHFVDEPPSVAQGGRGVVVPGCPTCKKRFGTMPMSHKQNRVKPTYRGGRPLTGHSSSMLISSHIPPFELI